MTALTRGLIFYVAVVATAALLVRLLGVRWWTTGVGRHLTAMIGSLAAGFTVLAASILWGPLPPWLWAAVLASIAVAVTWRLVLEVRGRR